MRLFVLGRIAVSLAGIHKELRRMNDMHQEESRPYVKPKPRPAEFSVAKVEDWVDAEKERNRLGI